MILIMLRDTIGRRISRLEDSDWEREGVGVVGRGVGGMRSHTHSRTHTY